MSNYLHTCSIGFDNNPTKHTTTTNISVKQPDQNNLSDMDRRKSKIVFASAIALLSAVYFCSLSEHSFFNDLDFGEQVDADGKLISSNRNKVRKCRMC